MYCRIICLDHLEKFQTDLKCWRLEIVRSNSNEKIAVSRHYALSVGNDMREALVKMKILGCELLFASTLSTRAGSKWVTGMHRQILTE